MRSSSSSTEARNESSRPKEQHIQASRGEKTLGVFKAFSSTGVRRLVWSQDRIVNIGHFAGHATSVATT